MAIQKFPVTQALAVIISGSVNTFADLPLVSLHQNEVWTVLTSTGVWGVNRKPAGSYLSTGLEWTTEWNSIDVIDSLTSSSAESALSANQGKILKGLIDNPTIVPKTANYTTIVTDRTIDCTTGTFNVTLLTAAGNLGLVQNVKNSGTGVITVLPNGAETIDGFTGVVLRGMPFFDSVTVQSTNTGWVRI